KRGGGGLGAGGGRGAGGGTGSEGRGGQDPGGGRLHRDGRMAAAIVRSRITAERPVNIRTIERYLLLAGDLPGLKFKNSIKPHPSKVGAAILVVEVTLKPADFFARVDNRHPGTRAAGIFDHHPPPQFVRRP